MCSAVECAMCRWCETEGAEIESLVAARVAADNGIRHDLDDVIETFGLTRAELEADDE